MKNRKNCSKFGNWQVEQLVGGEVLPQACAEAEKEGYEIKLIAPQGGYFMVVSKTQGFESEEHRKREESLASGEEQEDMFDEGPKVTRATHKGGKSKRRDVEASR